MSHRKRLSQLISALEKLLTRVESLTLNPGPATIHSASSLYSTDENSHGYKSGSGAFSSVPQEPKSETYLVDTVYPLFGDTLMGFSSAEQTLQSLERIPDAEWPSLDWNIDLQSINPEFFNLFSGT